MSQETKAIILAAGQGTRLRPYTDNIPKCLVELNNKPLLTYQVDALKDAGITDITIVTGFCADKIKERGFKTVHNKDFDTTNMVTSLMCASEIMDGKSDILIAYADIVYEQDIIEKLLQSQHPISTTIDQKWYDLWRLRAENPLEDAETLKLDSNLNITEIGRKAKNMEDIQGQYMGLIKVTAATIPSFLKFYTDLYQNIKFDGKSVPQMYMTSFLQHIIDSQCPIQAVLVKGGWLEIDTCEDLELFNDMIVKNTLDSFYRINKA